MVITPYNSTEDMTSKLQEIKGKLTLKFYENKRNYCHEMNIRRQNGNFQFGKNLFSESVKSNSKFYYEVLLIMIFLQTKPNIKKMHNNYYDLYYTVIKNRKDNVEEQDIIRVDEIDYISFENSITPNHYIGRKNDNSILR